MSNNNKILYLFILAICFVALQGCNRNKSNNDDIQDITQTNNVSLMKNMTVSTMGINDTINNIKGKVIFARNVKKDDDNLNLDPILNFMTQDLRQFAKKVKEIENPNRTDTNYYWFFIKSVYEKEDIISVLFEKKTHLTGTKDTIHELVTLNYNKESEDVYTFKDLFNINNTNLAAFNELFETNILLEDLNTISVNFERDMVWLNGTKENKMQRFGKPLKKVKKFLIDD